MTADAEITTRQKGSPREVFTVFLKLGLTSFGRGDAGCSGWCRLGVHSMSALNPNPVLENL